VPEGDTIHRAARTLHLALAGHEVVRFETAFAQLAVVDDQTPVRGRTVERVGAIGKHLLMYFSGDLILRTHMRMHGSWHIYRPGERWRRPRRDMRVVIATDAYEAVAFTVPIAEFRRAATLNRDEAIQALGPDLLDPGVDLEEAVRRLLALGDLPLGEALLTQRAVAGIGNVFKSEVCFEARLSPLVPVSSLGAERLRAVLEIARSQMRSNLSPVDAAFPQPPGRRTTRRMHPAEGLWVYGRAGEPCRQCGTPIAMRKSGVDARLTYYCETCQHVHASAIRSSS
jgi:endonuclease VIII